VVDFQEAFSDMNAIKSVSRQLQQKVDIDDVHSALKEITSVLDKKVELTEVVSIINDKWSSIQEVIQQKADVAQVDELLQQKATKNSVIAALKKKVNKEELEEEIQSVKQQMSIVEEYCEQLAKKQKLDQSSLHNNSTSHLATDAIIAELERATTKNTSEINRLILDLDLKPSRNEITDYVSQNNLTFLL
jgi:hypothetical protein